MFTVLFAAALLTVCIKSCSIAYPPEETLFISNVELLSQVSYPHSVLLTIQRTAPMTRFNVRPRLNYINYGPWCKIMNVNDGSVSDVVTCSDYTNAIREYATPDIDPKSTSVTCHDNCNGATATCIITRDGISYIMNNIPYLASSIASCNSLLPVYFGSISSSFTINDISTTYISFSTNMVGIQFNDNVSPITYQIYDVERRGDWSYLIPPQYGVDRTPSLYSAVNVIRVALPCCLCHGSKLNSYIITSDTNKMTQVFTMKALGFGGGNVDVIQQRVFNSGLFFSQSLTVYYLFDGNAQSVVLKPDLCDTMIHCFMPPCQQPDLTCPYNVNAQCVNDYCGGCNARWFCGASDITNWCDSGQTSNQKCLNEPMIGYKTTVL